jgi:Ribbon-helix-helix protein, copG family
MAESTNIVKRKAGRPVEIGAGATAFVGLRLPSELLERVEKWAVKKKKAGRSEAIRALIEQGLKK